ncbi:MAG: universal stress protein [Thermoplasmata archaeon]
MAPAPLDRIAVAVDGSRFAEAALDYAITLALRFQGPLSLLTVAPLTTYVIATEPWVPTEILEGEVRHYRGILEAAVARARAAGVGSVTGVFLEGPVIDEIVAFLEKNPCDLLIMGSRGQSAAKRLLLGSTSDAVLHHVTCTVLIVRAPAPPRPPTPQQQQPPPAGPAATGSR